jgi:hypothetical protein
MRNNAEKACQNTTINTTITKTGTQQYNIELASCHKATATVILETQSERRSSIPKCQGQLQTTATTHLHLLLNSNVRVHSSLKRDLKHG